MAIAREWYCMWWEHVKMKIHLLSPKWERGVFLSFTFTLAEQKRKKEIKHYKLKLISTHAAARTLVKATKGLDCKKLFNFLFNFIRNCCRYASRSPSLCFLCVSTAFLLHDLLFLFLLCHVFLHPLSLSLHPGPAVDSRWWRPGYSWLSGPRSCCAVLYSSSTCCALMALTLSLIATPSWLYFTLLCPSPCLLLLLLALFCILNIIFLVTTTHWLQAAKVSIGRYCCFCTQCICAAWK